MKKNTKARWKSFEECLILVPRSGVPFEALPKKYQTQEMELAIKTNGQEPTNIYKYEKKYNPKNAQEVMWSEGYR